MAGRYEFGDFIASGGMAEVWRARDTDYSRDVAIKLLKPEYADDPASRARFDAEARHVQSLEHANIAAVYDVGEMPTASGLLRPYLTMEYVPGRPLSAMIAAGPLDPKTVQSLLAQAGDGLAAAHRSGIVHRDVKPANLMVTDDGTLKITDFGIARSASQGAVTVTGQVVGTPQYLSPEQARGEVATPASDVYGLGVVCFEALTGSRPFDRPTAVATALAHLEDPVPDLPVTLPPALAAVVRQALAKDPADRFADGAAFSAALRGASLALPDLEAPTFPPPSVEVADDAPATVVVPAVNHADLETQAIAAVDLPVNDVADPAPTDFVPTTEAPADKQVDPLAPQRTKKREAEPVAPVQVAAVEATPQAEPDARADGATHAGTTVVRLPKAMQPLAARVSRHTRSWPFGTLDTVLVALAALTILAIGWVAYFLNSSAPPAPAKSAVVTSQAPATTTATATPSRGADVNTSCVGPNADGTNLKGRSLDDVTRILTDLGLKVDPVPGEAGKSWQQDDVYRIDPCRDVRQGDTIQVFYYSDNPTSGATP